MKFDQFLKDHTAKIKELDIEKNLAYWRAATGGNSRDYARLAELQFRISMVYANREEFSYISDILEEGEICGPLLERAARVLYLSYRGMQIDEKLLREISALSSNLQKKFNTFRPSLGGTEVSDNDIMDILSSSTDSSERRNAWEAQKRVGEVVAPDLIELVKLRNAGAAEAGFEDFYSMSLYLSETDGKELFDLMDQVEELTRKPFRRVKKRIDDNIADRLKISPEGLMPWHYSDPFFQRSKPAGGFELDPLFAGKEITAIASDYYARLGMPAAGVLERSDLYQREGKSPHAFCIDIDREGDVRILANIQDNAKWMGTLLHELGHAAYDLNIDKTLPYLLRKYPHYCLTEGSAMFFENMACQPEWLREFLNEEVTEENARSLKESSRAQKLIFARWCQTMVRFEKELYRDPEQGLDALWWDIAERYQLLQRCPGRASPDWASKIHFVTSPVYYQNYMLGELIAAQLRHHIRSSITEDFTGEAEKLSEYLKSRIYSCGSLRRWDLLIESATGEKLNPEYLARELEGI